MSYDSYDGALSKLANQPVPVAVESVERNLQNAHGQLRRAHDCVSRIMERVSGTGGTGSVLKAPEPNGLMDGSREISCSIDSLCSRLESLQRELFGTAP